MWGIGKRLFQLRVIVFGGPAIVEDNVHRHRSRMRRGDLLETVGYCRADSVAPAVLPQRLLFKGQNDRTWLPWRGRFQAK